MPETIDARDERGEPQSEPEISEPDTFLSLKLGGTEIYFVRHGDALPGQDEVVLGDYDAQALSDLGRRQAQALASRMTHYKPTAIYSSPTGRAMQTARATADALGLTISVDDGLREVELGSIGDDITTDDPAEVSKLLRARLREIADVAVTSGRWSKIPGSEASADLRARVVAAVERIHRRHPGERVAVFSHGGAINAYFADLLGLERDYFFPAANTSVSVARVHGPRRLLMALNDISHLREAGIFEESARMPVE
ncbi:MAG TPA: histidine phosphatase family protein [Ktedonobacterales bacterium]